MRALHLVLTVLFQTLRVLGHSRSDLILENLAVPSRNVIRSVIRLHGARSGGEDPHTGQSDDLGVRRREMPDSGAGRILITDR